MIQLLSGIDSTASALDAERIRMDVISQNIANVNTTKGLDGKPYQRQQVVFESVLQRATRPATPAARSLKQRKSPALKRTRARRAWFIIPSHPDANAQGMVAMPDINIHEEMVDMIASSRSYEANLAVVKNARAMAMQDLSIGKH